MDPHTLEIILAIVVSVMGSSGLWGYIGVRATKRDGIAAMVKGQAQHMIIREGTRLIEQGYVTQDEYRNLHSGLYAPYKALGGNGLAEKIVKEVEKLPMRKNQGEMQ